MTTTHDELRAATIQEAVNAKAALTAVVKRYLPGMADAFYNSLEPWTTPIRESFAHATQINPGQLRVEVVFIYDQTVVNVTIDSGYVVQYVLPVKQVLRIALSNSDSRDSATLEIHQADNTCNTYQAFGNDRKRLVTFFHQLLKVIS